MNTEKKEISKAFELVKFIWDNEKTDSYVRINSLMQDALKLAINAQFKFDKDDFKNICKSFSGGYWFGVNTNGKGMGEVFYNLACKVGNMSAAQSYEAFYDFKAFITTKGNRLNEYSELKHNNRRYMVTGFDFETKKIHCVSYELSDWQQNGKKQLHSFDNKEWNAVRKEFIEL
jgi:hypothetical protein